MPQKTSSNTGAQTPTKERQETTEEVLGFVDWITCSFPIQTNIKELEGFLGGVWGKANGGLNGYAQGRCCEGMSIWYAGGSGRGVGLQVTGKGCRELEVATIQNGWRSFLGELLIRKANFSRLDVAIDDHVGILDFNELNKCRRAGLFTSRFKDHNYFEAGKTGSTEITGSGIVFGARESRSFLRIYNKALQQGNDEHHVRVELEAKRENAHKLVQKIVQDGEEVIAGVIAGIIDFKVAGSASRKERLKTLPAWKRFTDNSAKLHFSTAPSEPSLEKSIKTLEKQYGPTMAMIERVYGPDRLLQIAKDGEDRLTAKHFSIIARYPERRRAC